MTNQPIDAPQWDLSDLYSGLNDPKIDSDLKQCHILTEQIKNQETELKKSPADINLWVEMLDKYKILTEINYRLQSYARMMSDQDTSNEEAVSLQSAIDEKVSAIEAQLSFFTNTIAELSDDDAQKLANDARIVNNYQEFIRDTRRLKPHILPNQEECLLIKTLYRERQAWSQFENQLSTRIPYPDLILENKNIKLNESIINKFLENQNAEIRSQAYDSRCLGFQKEYESLSYIYINQNRNIRTEYEIRKYPDILSYISDRDDIPKNLITNLFNSSKKYQSIFTNFYSWKATQLNLKRLLASDVIAPLPQSVDREFNWDQGKNIILSAFSALSEEYALSAEKFFTENWIHAQPLPRKNTGAYCMPTPQHAYLLTNYQNNLSSINTLTHELGHGIHDTLAKKQNLLQQHAGYIACETASQFAEILLLNYLEKNEPEIYKFELAQFISRAMNAIYQQILYTEFEFNAYTKAATEPLSPGWLANEWLRLRRDLAQDSIEFPDREKWNWSRISHIFFHPFYCYSYAVSLLVVLTLSQRHKQEPTVFAEQFKNFLSAGGSMSDHKLIKHYFELDLTDTTVLDQGFETLQQYIQKL